jgi:hypothetical protein
MHAQVVFSQCFDQITPLSRAQLVLLYPVPPPRIYCCFWFVFVVFYPMLLMLVHNSLATVAFQSIVSHGCQRDQLHRCVKTAEPLLRNPDYVVPATLSDVSTHCRSLHSADTSCFSIVTFLWWKLTTGIFLFFNFKESGLNLSIASETTPWSAWRAIGDNNNCKSR